MGFLRGPGGRGGGLAEGRWGAPDGGPGGGGGGGQVVTHRAGMGAGPRGAARGAAGVSPGPEDPVEWKLEQLRRRREVLEATEGAAWTRAQQHRAAERVERVWAAAAAAKERDEELRAGMGQARGCFREARHALQCTREAAQWHVAREQFVQAGKEMYPKWREAVNTFTHSRSREVDRALGEAERRQDAHAEILEREQELREKMSKLWQAVGPPNLGQSPRGEEGKQEGGAAEPAPRPAPLSLDGDGYRSDEVLQGSANTSVEPSPRVHFPDGLGERDSMTSVKEAFAALSDSKLHLPLQEAGLAGPKPARPPLPRSGAGGSVGASPREWAQDTPRSQVSEGGNSSNLSTPRLENALSAAVERVLDGGRVSAPEAASGGQTSKISTPRLEVALATAVDHVLQPAVAERPVQSQREVVGRESAVDASNPGFSDVQGNGAPEGGAKRGEPPELEGESSLSIPLDVSTALNDTEKGLYRSNDEDFNFDVDQGNLASEPSASVPNEGTGGSKMDRDISKPPSGGASGQDIGVVASISEQSSGYVSPPSEEVEAERRAWQEEMRRRDRDLEAEREAERQAILAREAKLKDQVENSSCKVTPQEVSRVGLQDNQPGAAAPRPSPGASRKSKLASLSLGALGADPFAGKGAEQSEPFPPLEKGSLVPATKPKTSAAVKPGRGGILALPGDQGKAETLKNPEMDASLRIMGAGSRSECKKNISSIVDSALREDDEGDFSSGDDDGHSFGETATSASAVSAASPIRTSTDFEDEFDVF